MRIDRFEDIEAWQLAREHACKAYVLTKKASVSFTWLHQVIAGLPARSKKKATLNGEP